MKAFQTEIEAENWLYANYKELIQYVQENCSIESRDNPAYLLYLYGGSGNELYNPVLRVAKGDQNRVKEYLEKNKQIVTYNEIEVLNYFIKSNLLKQDLVLFRFEKISIKERFNLLITPKDKKIKDYGFLSTTLLPDSKGILELKENVEFNILYKFNTPKGIPCVPLQFNKDQTKLQEYEMLLPTGIEKTLIRKTFNMKRRMLMFEFNLTYNSSE